MTATPSDPAEPLFPGMPDRVHAVRAVVVLTLSAPVAAWWAIGDQQDPYASEAVQPA